jgi:hypothetical protein
MVRNRHAPPYFASNRYQWAGTDSEAGAAKPPYLCAIRRSRFGTDVHYQLDSPGLAVKAPFSGITLTICDNRTSCGTYMTSTYSPGHIIDGLLIDNSGHISVGLKTSNV